MPIVVPMSYCRKFSVPCLMYIDFRFLNELRKCKKVQVGKDQEKAQSEKDSHSKNRGGKKPNQQSGTYTMKHIVSRMSSYFPNRWPLSYLNLTKNMKTYIKNVSGLIRKFGLVSKFMRVYCMSCASPTRLFFIRASFNLPSV